jgi:cysteine synthase
MLNQFANEDNWKAHYKQPVLKYGMEGTVTFCW